MKHSVVKTRFGSVVRKHRSRLGFSQETLAERAELHRTYLSDIERGVRNISLESIQKLAAALQISLGSFFLEMEEAQPPEDLTTRSTDLVDLLLVEDNPNDVELTLKAVKDGRVTNRIYVAGDGAEAFEFLFATGRHSHRLGLGRPKVVLLDLNLSKISGLDVLRKLKADPRTDSIPVIVLTMSQNDQATQMSQHLGADGYIVKPLDIFSLSKVSPRLNLNWALFKPPMPIVA